MTKKILAIIPARGGSKGLPRKNIIDLAGKPLIAWTIEASLGSKYITKTIVSSDSDEILEVARRYGSVILKRPDEFATDTSSSEVVVKHAIESIEEKFDYVVLLQPTSPLRDTVDIDDAFEKLFSLDATALISVCKYDNKILKAFKENELGYIEGVSNNKYPFMRRQDLPKTYMSNGAIYIIKVDDFFKNNSFFTDKTISFIMDEVKSMDIDVRDDLKKVERFIVGH
ncbi:cytidylyltransferase domain-containing protein [Aliarcobacter butzleri]|uniref:Acylneuraminate cytidylyltransferase family protein n=1 Tax=Aliarcobacter butzleri TaxID=28197 RepID=A0AAW7Q5E7_9BACT|nr:acylneuraminate cytidylyltransferase family protein [Aliarcobacter butzleri]MDN5114350.1 acylneuraminate cytidylyltransferase family protein [Aliarcobacter butzleri]